MSMQDEMKFEENVNRIMSALKVIFVFFMNYNLNLISLKSHDQVFSSNERSSFEVLWIPTSFTKAQKLTDKLSEITDLNELKTE